MPKIKQKVRAWPQSVISRGQVRVKHPGQSLAGSGLSGHATSLVIIVSGNKTEKRLIPSRVTVSSDQSGQLEANLETFTASHYS